MGRRAVNVMEKIIRWLKEASQKVAEAIYQPFKFSELATIKQLEEKRDYYKENSNASLYTYLIKLGRNKRTKFGKCIKNFINSTKTSSEESSIIVMENIRQFMNEMKNYLIANGDVKYDKEVIKAKSKGPKTFDLDEILENVVCELVLIPLKEHLDDLIFREFSPSVTLVMEVMYHVRESSLHEVGVKAPLRPFSEEELAIIRNDLYKIQTSDLPSEKLKYFLAAVSSIFKFTKSYISGRKVDICTDDFIPLLIWVLSQCRTFTVEVEALYMCYLLNPSIMLGESGYYTRSLLSAGALLNETNKIFRNSATDVDSCQCSNRIEESSKEIKMVIIDQLNGLPLNVKTIRLKPNTKAKDICSVMARKLHVKHPEFFGLFMVVDGKAKILNDNFRLETIQESVQRDLRSKNCFFIYKEINKKLAWPFSNY